ncbi:hypothetical protein MNB_SM-6-92 [hydrothermal vent metagenome]|uniref:Lysophospholipase n=1 Tax=hydrothermal vent metagenome TaxID=652676 RepID=A0A1W1C8J2_9ZZZZ
MKSMQHSSKYFIALSMIVMLNACGTEGNTGSNSVADGSVQFVGATVIDDINASVMLQVVKNNINPLATNAFGYKAVKISYNTVNEDGSPVVASGLLVIPTATAQYQQYRLSQGKQPFSVSMLCNNHGTIFLDSAAPSNAEVPNGIPDYPQAVLMTGYAGFAAIYPDYIGFGDSNTTIHPYIMKKASAQASLDMIKASMKYMEDNNIVLNHQLYISGYSEGGYVAMATAQKVEAELGNVNLMGVAPMAGPYNVEDLADVDLNATQKMTYPAFLADLAYSYAHYYDDVNLSDIAVQPLAKFQLAFNGSYDTVAIHTILGLANPSAGDYGFFTHATNELFQDSFISDYQNNKNNIMRQKFDENSLDNWTPRSKMNLIQCVDDEIIPFSESQNTYNKMKANGADVTLTPIPTILLSQKVDAAHPFVHANCAKEAYGAAVLWFAAIRNGDIK